MKKPLIVVTGVNGQLGWSIQNIANNFSEFEFLFADRNLLDLSNPGSIPDFFKQYQPKYFINCALLKIDVRFKIFKFDFLFLFKDIYLN